MGRQGTWEILLLPAGKTAGKGIASKIQNGSGSAQSGHGPRQAPTEPAGETNKPKDTREQEVVAS